MTMKAPAALLPAPFTVSMMKSPGQTRNARSRSRCIVGLRHATKASALPDDGDDAARRLLASERPTHLVAIERPGRARDGTYRNMRGADVSEWNAGIDELFVRAGRVTTVGVGDGGNEIGMGNVRARLAKGGGLAARIASVVSVDHLVVAGVSNWGAYGIVAHLGRLA